MKFGNAEQAPERGNAQAAFERNGKGAVTAAVHSLLPHPLTIGPPSVGALATWLVEYLFEPPAKDETMRETVGGKHKTPYRDRIVYLTQKLMALPELEQRMVLAHREDGVFWRGDSMADLQRIADERERLAGMSADERRRHMRGRIRALAPRLAVAA